MVDLKIIEIYSAKSAVVFKNIIQLLSQSTSYTKSQGKSNIKRAFFKFSKEGLDITISTSEFIMIQIFLEASSFCNYTFNKSLTSEINLAIPLDILKKEFSTAKVHQGLTITVEQEPDCKFRNQIYFTFNSQSDYAQGGVKSILINCDISQNTLPIIDNNRTYIISIPASKLKDLCCNLGTIKDTVMKVDIQSDDLTFSINHIGSKTTTLFKTKDVKIEKTLFFKSEYFKQISKMSSICDSIDIHYIGQVSETDPYDYVYLTSNILKPSKDNSKKIKFGTLKIKIRSNLIVADSSDDED